MKIIVQTLFFCGLINSVVSGMTSNGLRQRKQTENKHPARDVCKEKEYDNDTVMTGPDKAGSTQEAKKENSSGHQRKISARICINIQANRNLWFGVLPPVGNADADEVEKSLDAGADPNADAQTFSCSRDKRGYPLWAALEEAFYAKDPSSYKTYKQIFLMLLAHDKTDLNSCVHLPNGLILPLLHYVVYAAISYTPALEDDFEIVRCVLANSRIDKNKVINIGDSFVRCTVLHLLVWMNNQNKYTEKQYKRYLKLVKLLLDTEGFDMNVSAIHYVTSWFETKDHACHAGQLAIDWNDVTCAELILGHKNYKK